MPSDSPDRIYLQWHGDQEPEHCNGEPGEVTWSREAVYRHDIEYRRYSGPSPEVLMRALENLVIAYGGVASLYDFEDEVKDVDELIAEAEAEIEAEMKGGAK